MPEMNNIQRSCVSSCLVDPGCRVINFKTSAHSDDDFRIVHAACRRDDIVGKFHRPVVLRRQLSRFAILASAHVRSINLGVSEPEAI